MATSTPSSRPTAVVTGASKGIGRAIALRLARAGMGVWALARSEDELQSLKAEVNGGGGAIFPLQVDVSREDQVIAACERILKDGTPYALVNNAGIARSSPLAKTPLSDFEDIMTVNVRAPFIFCQKLMPAMAKAGGGRVVNIASTAALKGFKYTSIYCASKHALLGLTRSLAVEYGAKKVTVNALCPGWTDTSMVTRTADAIAQGSGGTHEEARERLADMNPLKRLVLPEEVAELCLFLASETSGAVTGAHYMIDGGETAI